VLVDFNQLMPFVKKLFCDYGQVNFINDYHNTITRTVNK